MLDVYSDLLLTYANEKQVLIWSYNNGVVLNRLNTTNAYGNINLILDKRYNKLISCGQQAVEEFDFSAYIGREDITLPNNWHQGGALDTQAQNLVYYPDHKDIKVWDK